MDMYVLCAVAVLSAMLGFWLGKSLQWRFLEEEETTEGKRILKGREIVSPVNGVVNVEQENGMTMVHILPDQGKLYAPASGRISRLYPMGSAMLLETDFGARVLLQAGIHADDMCSEFYRCRVMEREIVKKGALLLEYDPKMLAARGVEPDILLCVENEDDFETISSVQSHLIKTGEMVLSVVGTALYEPLDGHAIERALT